jgi:hypothetical protein
MKAVKSELLVDDKSDGRRFAYFTDLPSFTGKKTEFRRVIQDLLALSK